MGKRKPNFKRDLVRGKRGEEMLVALWPDVFMALEEECRAYDCRHVDGRTVELKTDYYDHVTTPNFFMEYASHEKPGGPWRSLRDRVDIFAYLFVEPHPLLHVWEDVPRLVEVLNNRFVPSAPERNICNGKWAAQGYLVDRELLVKYSNPTVFMVNADINTQSRKQD